MRKDESKPAGRLAEEFAQTVSKRNRRGALLPWDTDEHLADPRDYERDAVDEEEYRRIKAENPKAAINSREAAYYYKIFREYHPQDSILGSIGIWTGFDFAEEREQVRGTMDGDLKHEYQEETGT